MGVDEQGAFAAKVASGKASVSVQTKGQKIMQLADAILPGLRIWLEGAKDWNGMPLQSAHVRGIALNMAQHMLKDAA